MLCNTLPHNHQLTIDKLKAIPQLSQGGEQINKLISSSADVRKINEKITTYLFVKLCYSGRSPELEKCDVVYRLIDSPTVLQQSCYGKNAYLYTCFLQFLKKNPNDYNKVRIKTYNIYTKRMCLVCTWFLKMAFVQKVDMCVYPLPRLLLTMYVVV